MPDPLDPMIADQLSDEDYALYAGFYQGLAFAQGANDGPLKFVWPDELMRQDWAAPLSFDRRYFYAVVAELDDEATIHYFETPVPNGPGIIHCTEDATPDPELNIFDEGRIKSAYQHLVKGTY